MKPRVYLPAIIMLAAVLTSCSKDEGVGGTATIRGKVIIQDYNDDFSLLLSQYNAAEEDVYIIYGEDETFGDQVETSYDGTFEFRYLLPGDYRIFIYSLDSTSNLLYDTVVIKDITVSKKDDLVDAGIFVKLNTLEFDDGNSSITGRLFEINYDPNTICTTFPEVDTAYAQEEDVYIVYGDHSYYDDRTRTYYNGTYTFNNLIKGTYRIYMYSDDLTGATQKIPIIRQVEITEENQQIVIPDIYINNL